MLPTVEQQSELNVKLKKRMYTEKMFVNEIRRGGLRSKEVNVSLPLIYVLVLVVFVEFNVRMSYMNNQQVLVGVIFIFSRALTVFYYFAFCLPCVYIHIYIKKFNRV